MAGSPKARIAAEDGPAREAALALLAARAPGATICPSEVARALTAEPGEGTADDAWRALMPAVHAAVDSLVDEKRVRLSWKGEALATRAGPYRIGPGVSD